MTDITEEHVKFPAGNDRCEGVLAYGSHPVSPVAVLFLCPHPLLGGNMRNNVIEHLARRTAEDGGISLRFNYRGVGNSTRGGIPGGRHFDYFSAVEKDQQYEVFLPEVFAAGNFLRSAVKSETALVVAGYSLGVVLAGMAATTMEPQHIVAIGPPNARVSLDPFMSCTVPKTFVAGAQDIFFSQASFEAAFQIFPDPKTLLLLPEADHFFRGDEEKLYAMLRSALLGKDPA